MAFQTDTLLLLGPDHSLMPRKPTTSTETDTGSTTGTETAPGTRDVVLAKHAADATQSAMNIVFALVHVFTILVERVGFLGATGVGLFGWFWYYSTAEQKHAFIDQYILGRGMGPWWPSVVLTVAFVAAVAAQETFWRRKTARLQAELKRTADEKSRMQERRAKRSLRHANLRDQQGGK